MKKISIQMRQIKTNTIFNSVVEKSQARVSDNLQSKIELHRNEFPLDLPDPIKDNILQKLRMGQWNRYPKVRNDKLISGIAEYNHIKPDSICLGAGAAMLITTLMNYFAFNKKKLIILRPSFSLYEYHCKTYGIHYSPWPLNTQMQFDISSLPALDNNSIVLLVTPNNPTGSELNQAMLVDLVSKNPESLFIVDEVYHEFSKINNTPLLETFNNLILIRSFSKSFMTAGIRFGYCLSAPSLQKQIEKVVLPFSINHFAACAAEYLLGHEVWKIIHRHNLAQIIIEREKTKSELISMDAHKDLMVVYPSNANFLLIKLLNKTLHTELVRLFEESQIAILDTSNLPLIPNSIRITIGTEHENQQVLDVFNKFYKLKIKKND
jgi:histidinol-phosphate aminotransferase